MDGHSETPGKRLIGVTFNIHDRKCRETEIAQINQQLTEQNRLLQQLNATLERLAANDSLTGLSNRRTLMELGAKEAKRTERFGHPMSLLVADIDLFKSVNDMTMTFVPEGADGSQTRVTWTMVGPQTFMTKVMGLFTSMDKMVGPDFEKGLQQLKAVAERSGG